MWKHPSYRDKLKWFLSIQSIMSVHRRHYTEFMFLSSPIDLYITNIVRGNAWSSDISPDEGANFWQCREGDDIETD